VTESVSGAVYSFAVDQSSILQPQAQYLVASLRDLGKIPPQDTIVHTVGDLAPSSTELEPFRLRVRQA
jgi:hypothetical protein